MWRLNCFLLFLGLQLALAKSEHDYFYRKDYTYIQEYNAFFKLHWDKNVNSWDNAFLTCEDEGATLFYPKEDGEHGVVKKLMKKLENLPNITYVFIGIHNKYHIGEYITVDGHAIPPFIGSKLQRVEGDDKCIIMDSSNPTDYKSSSCTRMMPVLFVCKRSDDKLCPTIDRGYKYYDGSKKCYKLNKKAKKWDDAMQTCYLEGGLLANVDKDMSASQFRSAVNVLPSTEYHIGIRDLFKNGNYYTVKGIRYDKDIEKMITPLGTTPRYDLPFAPDDMSSEEYRNIYNIQYDEVVPRRREVPTTEVPLECVVVYDSILRAISCDTERQFICEMDI